MITDIEIVVDVGLSPQVVVVRQKGLDGTLVSVAPSIHHMLHENGFNTSFTSLLSQVLGPFDAGSTDQRFVINIDEAKMLVVSIVKIQPMFEWAQPVARGNGKSITYDELERFGSAVPASAFKPVDGQIGIYAGMSLEDINLNEFAKKGQPIPAEVQAMIKDRVARETRAPELGDIQQELGRAAQAARSGNLSSAAELLHKNASRLRQARQRLESMEEQQAALLDLLAEKAINADGPTEALAWEYGLAWPRPS